MEIFLDLFLFSYLPIKSRMATYFSTSPYEGQLTNHPPSLYVLKKENKKLLINQLMYKTLHFAVLIHIIQPIKEGGRLVDRPSYRVVEKEVAILDLIGR